MKPTPPSPTDRPCPVCGSTTHHPFADERLDPRRIGRFTYASRKKPEFMCLQLVRCDQCDLVYATRPPGDAFLSNAYASAAYDSSMEARCAAKSYARAMKPYLEGLATGGAAVDVGAGSGPLLPWLADMGFNPVVGVEPSRAAIEAAPPSVRPLLREGMFSPELLADIRPSLICSFMTLEHMSDPAAFVNASYDMLSPGGMIAVVTHNRQGLVNRMLGLRSPIIDVEHLQLFNPASVCQLLRAAGFSRVEVKPIWNAYPVRYWLRLTPLPDGLKTFFSGILKRLPAAEITVPLRVGNILAVATKPESEPI